MNLVRMKRPLIVVLVTLGVLFCILFLVLSLFLFLFTVPHSRSTQPTFETFHYQEIDFAEQKTTSDFVQIDSSIMEDDFTTYRNEETGHSVILSNFADSKFECSATCVCRDNQRRNSAVLTRGLSLVISALSSTLALRMAENAILDHCSFRFKETCDQENVEVLESVCEEEKPRKKRLKKDDILKYRCIGNCVARSFHIKKSMNEQKKWEEERGKCDTHGTIGTLRIKKTKDITLYEIEDQMKRVKSLFHRNYIKNFCRAVSLLSYKTVNRKGDDHVWRSNVCWGGREKDWETSIKCSLATW